MIEAPQISDAWIAERWPDQDSAEVRRRFDALMERLGDTPSRAMPRFPEVMQPVLVWAGLLPPQRVDLLVKALAEVPDYLRKQPWSAERPMFGEQRVKFENVVGDSGYGTGRQAVAITPYIKGYNLAPWIAAASPGNVGALLGEMRRLGERVCALLAAVNRQVEKRREAAALLREAASLFRTYEGHHRAKASEAGRPEKAERNAEIAGRIEAFLASVHQ